MTCPDCGNYVKSGTCGACGWKKGSTGFGGQVGEHYRSRECCWTTDGRRCTLLGSISAGGGDVAKFYCLWHYVVLGDISRNTPAMFAEWRDSISGTHPDSVWASDPEYLWDCMSGRKRVRSRGSMTNDDNTEDAELSKICSKLVAGVLSHAITREGYLKGLMELNKKYPGAGFLQSVKYLRGHWEEEGREEEVG